MCKNLIHDCWFADNKRSISEKLKILAPILLYWGLQSGDSFSKQILDCKKQVEALKGQNITHASADYMEVTEFYSDKEWY